MEISLTHRLSYKQASLTVLVAFLLGTVLCSIQVGFDYLSEDASIDREIQALLDTSYNPAARIAYNLDAELAQELVVGLLRSPAVIQASIISADHNLMAHASRPASDSQYRFISDSLFGARRQFERVLLIDRAPEENLGSLRIEVDTYAFGSNFLRRSMLTIASGFARTLLLSLILLVMFYFMLTKPLIEVVRALSSRTLDKPNAALLPCPRGHEHDEIGTLVGVANQQLLNIDDEIKQRKNAEQRLNQSLLELESAVAQRTAELKATNARLLKSNHELEHAQQQALQTAQSRATFLANMSHEIRTPLNGLLGMLSLALDNPSNSEQQQQLSIAHHSGKVLVDLLNDILDLSKFESGQLQLEHIAFDLCALVEDTASLLSQNASPGVELTCLIDPELPAEVLGDPTRVGQIISNLISNALKFTRFGRVDVRIRPAGAGIELSVRDTGIGITEDAYERIFEPFTQADAGITRQYGGTGLGLALSRHLCEIMQGTLSLQSKVGFGSEFTAYLPLTGCAPAPAWGPLRGKIIALTSVSSGLHEMLKTQLPHWGLEYQRLDTDASLLGYTADVVISDCPECLYSTRLNCQAPILLVTAYGSFLAPEQAKSLAPLEQLARPMPRKVLYHALERHFHTRPLELKNRAAGHAEIDYKACVLLVEDNPVNQLVAKGMLIKLGYKVIIANDGEHALKQLSEHAVDLILMDCNMPIMDGYEASRRIRQSGQYAGLPIIALTANALSDERQRCTAAGMSDYLAKPFTREELISVLETALNNRA
ncbi:hybrid sensor histidine kinase/response regulator [Pseudomonas segetis]|uniref:histidine kinase n=1 Tax=Pseudomonas segetis TaxID=298908 RepID=A0A239J4T1_9PSED|nr:response regulator [Pseudomonas segetis]SNS99654.1 Signal transduction histidine kinase [Pseudomonas segetis]